MLSYDVGLNPLPLRQSESSFCIRIYNLQQSVSLQVRCSVELPGQSRPPVAGGGLLQVRVRIITPSPHVREHRDQGDQGDQLPGSVNERREMHAHLL